MCTPLKIHEWILNLNAMQIAKQRSLFYVQILVLTRGALSSDGCMEKITQNILDDQKQ